MVGVPQLLTEGRRAAARLNTAPEVLQKLIPVQTIPATVLGGLAILV